MASNLFNLANRALQRLAQRAYSQTPIGRAAAAARIPRRASSASAYLNNVLNTPQAKRLMQEATGLGGYSVERYTERSSGVLDQLLRSLGPLGEAIRLAVGQPRSSLHGSQLESAISLIRALGGEYLTADKSSPHYQRGIQAARKVLGTAPSTELPPHVVMDRLNDILRNAEAGGAAGGGGSGIPPRGPTTGGGDEWPEEHGITLLGRGSAMYDTEAMQAIQEREIKTPQSSNVYSFVFEEETDPSGKFYQRSGILYVTFRPWYPGMKERPNGPGPMYAYYDVPLRRYKAFKANAQYGSAGEAVWEYLRVRGSKWDHRFPYRLVGGVKVPAGGVYVPRRATQLGLRKRSLVAPGVGRRGFVRSQLPERPWAPNRAEPDRGEPNRGLPFRGDEF